MNDLTIPGRSRFKALVVMISIIMLVMMLMPVTVNSSEHDIVRVGYYEQEVFQEGASEGEVKTGYAYEYYQKLSEYTGWQYEYVYGEFGDLYQMLLDGDIDFLAGLAYREERADIIGYPDSPMGNETYSLVKHDDDIDITLDPQRLTEEGSVSWTVPWWMCSRIILMSISFRLR